MYHFLYMIILSKGNQDLCRLSKFQKKLLTTLSKIRGIKIKSLRISDYQKCYSEWPTASINTIKLDFPKVVE